jgi:RHS repeat-associated protein
METLLGVYLVMKLAMSWTGRQLNSITNNGTTSSYLYNADGIRIKKTVGSTVTEYFTNGSTILAEKTGSNILWYIYDSDGEILGFTYNGTPYYYIKNVQGDVYKVVNASGSVVASYTYDAWGKVLSAIGSMAQINPIRYRSYYYDAETGFYYLQSRYYDPETGRFLNADGQLNVGFGLIGCNLFAYCYNNTIAGVDYDGNRPKFERSFGGKIAYTDSAKNNLLLSKSNRKPGKTPPSSWPPLPESLGGKKPKWNPNGYWEGKSGRRHTWDDRSHGAGVDRGNGVQDGHWDDETSNDRWDRNGNLLSVPVPDNSVIEHSYPNTGDLWNISLGIGGVAMVVVGVVYLYVTGDPSMLQQAVG